MQIKEVARFFVSGCAAVATDLTTYHLLCTFCSYELSKGLSFLLGTLVAYVLNKFWTFESVRHSWKELFSFGLLYAITLCLNVAVNQFMLSYLPWLGAFLIATGASTVANFTGQKFWVFNDKNLERAS